MLARGLAVALTVVVALFVVAVPVEARTPAELDAQVTQTLDGMAYGWAQAQDERGLYVEPLAGVQRGSYGQDMLAYATARAAQRNADPALAAVAVHAYDAILNPAAVASPFSQYADAYAYELGGLPPRVTDRIAAYLASYHAPGNGDSVDCTNPACYSNLVLNDALAVLSSAQTGLGSVDPTARLHDPQTATAKALAVINVLVPSVLDGKLRGSVAGDAVGGSVLSDPSRNPLAYHALSAFLMTEAVSRAGQAANARAWAATRATLDALSVLVSPDGELSYMGRGQGQVWVPAVTVAAMISGAKLFSSDPARASRYLTVAQAAMDRLRSAFVAPNGRMTLTAGGRTDLRGVDHYATTIMYNGLAAFALQAALDNLPQVPAQLTFGSEPSTTMAVDPAATGMAVLRKGAIWMAVHDRIGHPDDLRYDFGLLAAKRRGPDGHWSDLLAPRPLTTRMTASAGPALMVGARAALPAGTSVSVSNGEVIVRGGFRLAGRWVRRGVTFTYTPTATGVRLAVTGRPGDRYRLTTFLPAAGTTPMHVTGAKTATAAVQRGSFHLGPVADLSARASTVKLAGSTLTVTVG